MSKTPEQRAARRRRRRLVAFVTLPGVMIGCLGMTTAYAEGWMTRKPVAKCTGITVPAPSPKGFTVQVLNATYRAGVAGAAAKDVARHGFVVGTVGNDEVLRSILGEGEVRYPPTMLEEALYVRQTLLPGARLVEDEAVGKSVALVLGQGFKALRPLPPQPPVQASKTTVNVYNTTYYEGLARRVSDELGRRGFVQGKVGGDPRNTWQQGVGVIRHGENGDRQAKLVAQHLPGVLLEVDGRKDTSVDVVIGMQLNDVSKLTPQDKVPPQPKYTPPSWPTITRPCS